MNDSANAQLPHPGPLPKGEGENGTNALKRISETSTEQVEDVK